jgi:membrane AbrB-like protein
LFRLPAAFLIGPLVAAVVLRVFEIDLHLSQWFYMAAQSVVGAMLGSALTPSIVDTFRTDWAILLVTVAVIIAASTMSGWALSRFGVVPRSTGVWGASPGAASANIIQAAAYGADVRLVAFMQYVRVLFVASAASLVARFAVSDAAPPETPIFFPAIHPTSFAMTIGILAVTGALGAYARIPSGAMIAPLLTSAILHGAGTFAVNLPPWLLVVAYTTIGWTIGLGFTRAAVSHAARAVPWVVVSTLVVMAVCAGLAALLVIRLGIDPLTAYLATSPGGMDTIVIIAASARVDVAFVMALQAARFFILIAIGPALSRWVTRRLSHR